VLAQEAVDEKENECAAIPDLLDRLDLCGALVTIDAIACNLAVAKAVTDRQGDYLLAVKANQPTLFGEITRYFDDAAVKLPVLIDLDKGHGRLKTRRYAVSHEVGWLSGDRRYPAEPRFSKLSAIGMVEAVVEKAGTATTTRRFYLSSAPPSAWPRRCAATGASRTACTGCST
jgi:predicted transposase YbfD/YdcC